MKETYGPDHPEHRTWFDFYVGSWQAYVPVWNGEPTNYNPSGRKFKRKELALMAQQEGFDQTGTSGLEVAATAEELLTRAKEIAELGRRFR